MVTTVHNFNKDIAKEVAESQQPSLPIALSADPSALPGESAGFHTIRKSCQGAGGTLLKRYAKSEVQPMLERIPALSHDHAFWDHTLDGLAVLEPRICLGLQTAATSRGNGCRR